jgi:putative transposase
MPRRHRVFPDHSVLHVINRGNERRHLFAQAADYDTFLRLVDRTKRRTPIRLLAYVLMPNHWHLVVWPTTCEQLSQFMHDLTGLHALRLRHDTGTAGLGHVYQDRFRAHVIEQDVRYVRTIRYVEANPVRAGLVASAEEWRWSSLRERVSGRRRLDDGPVSLPMPEEWAAFVNAPSASVFI